MEKGPSTYAQYWISENSEVKHFKDHGKQMGFNKIIDYSRAAVEFATAERKSIISFTANEKKYNSTYKYDKDTNEFMIISKDGKSVTYFPPTDGIEYFYTQFEKWGDYWN